MYLLCRSLDLVRSKLVIFHFLRVQIVLGRNHTLATVPCWVLGRMSLLPLWSRRLCLLGLLLYVLYTAELFPRRRSSQTASKHVRRRLPSLPQFASQWRGNCHWSPFCLRCWRQRLDDGKPTKTKPIQDSGHVAGFKSAVGQDQHQRRLTIVSQRNGRQHVTLASSLTVNCRWTCMLLLSAGAVTTNWSSYIQSHGHCLYRQLRRPRIWVEGHPQLCSSDDHQLLIPQTWTVTFGARAFYTSGPTSWNALLAMLHHPALSLRCFGHFV